MALIARGRKVLELIVAVDLANARAAPEPFEKKKKLPAKMRAKQPQHTILRESLVGIDVKSHLQINFVLIVTYKQQAPFCRETKET